MKTIEVPDFIYSGEGIIIGLSRARFITLWQIQNRFEGGLGRDAVSVPPELWAALPQMDRYITVEYPDIEEIIVFADDGVKPSHRDAVKGNATALFQLLFGMVA